MIGLAAATCMRASQSAVVVPTDAANGDSTLTTARAVGIVAVPGSTRGGAGVLRRERSR